MKAMIFAAGKGTRLRPLTHNTPKALVKINRTPIIERVILKLISFGISEIIINVHYLSEQIITFLESKNYFGIKIIISDESNQLLDTGGGLKKASYFFNDNQPFILHNTDVISNIDLASMLDVHKQNNALATLAVRDRNSSRHFLFNQNNELCGWRNSKTKDQIISKYSNNYKALAFSGIHIISPKIFDYIDQNGAFSIVNTYLKLSKHNLIQAYQHDKDYWFDIGTIENLKTTEQYLSNQNIF